jgi:hypothetical protein
MPEVVPQSSSQIQLSWDDLEMHDIRVGAEKNLTLDPHSAGRITVRLVKAKDRMSMTDPTAEEQSQPQVLGYVRPSFERRGRKTVLAASWFGLGQSICVVILMVIGREPLSLYEIPGVILVVGIGSLGFSLSFLLLRPSAEARRWPYVCAATAGAGSLGVWAVVVRLLNDFRFYFTYPFLITIGSFFLAFVMTSFITSLVLLWAGKRIFDRAGPR